MSEIAGIANVMALPHELEQNLRSSSLWIPKITSIETVIGMTDPESRLSHPTDAMEFVKIPACS